MKAKRYLIGIAIWWTLVVVCSFAWNLWQQRSFVLEKARDQARQAYSKDVIFRSWNAMYGPIYLPVTDRTPPNPYLPADGREVQTTTGMRLAMVNPAYMTRLVHEVQSGKVDVRGHITALRPIRPENAPDEWEKEALTEIDKRMKVGPMAKPLAEFDPRLYEVSSEGIIEGKRYLRLMLPLITVQGCLPCHAKHGFQEGDVRGGISAAVPIEKDMHQFVDKAVVVGSVHLFVWALGMALLWLVYGRMRKESPASGSGLI